MRFTLTIALRPRFHVTSGLRLNRCIQRGVFRGETDYTDYNNYTDYIDYTDYADYTNYTGNDNYTDYIDYIDYIDYTDYADYTNYTGNDNYTDYTREVKHDILRLGRRLKFRVTDNS